jgi:hypothetical protein
MIKKISVLMLACLMAFIGTLEASAQSTFKTFNYTCAYTVPASISTNEDNYSVWATVDFGYAGSPSATCETTATIYLQRRDSSGFFQNIASKTGTVSGGTNLNATFSNIAITGRYTRVFVQFSNGYYNYSPQWIR